MTRRLASLGRLSAVATAVLMVATCCTSPADRGTTGDGGRTTTAATAAAPADAGQASTPRGAGGDAAADGRVAVPPTHHATTGEMPASLLFGQSGAAETRLTILRRRLATPGGQPEVVMDLDRHSSVTYLPGPERPYLAVDVDRRPDIGGEEFAADPELSLYDVDGRHLVDLGPGQAADLSFDGKRLAWVAFESMRRCFGDEAEDPEPCTVPSGRVVVSAPDGTDRRSFGPLEEALGVRWAGPRRLLVFGARRRAWIVEDVSDTGAAPRQVPMQDRFIDVDSATGEMLVSSRDLFRLKKLRLDGSAAWEANFEPFLLEAAWSPAARRAVVHMLRTHDTFTSERKLALVDTDTGEVRWLEERRSDGDLTWSADGRWFAFRTLDGSTFTLHVCRTSTVECHPVMSWHEGVLALAIEP